MLKRSLDICSLFLKNREERMWSIFINDRCESQEIVIMNLLNNRLDFEEKDQQHYYNSIKGYEGEKTFDHFLRKIATENLVLSDLLLEVSNKIFQVDSLVITKRLFTYLR